MASSWDAAFASAGKRDRRDRTQPLHGAQEAARGAPEHPARGHELGTRTPDAEACPAARAHPGLARRDVSARGHVFSGHSGSTG